MSSSIGHDKFIHNTQCSLHISFSFVAFSRQSLARVCVCIRLNFVACLNLNFHFQSKIKWWFLHFRAEGSVWMVARKLMRIYFERISFSFCFCLIVSSAWWVGLLIANWLRWTTSHLFYSINVHQFNSHALHLLHAHVAAIRFWKMMRPLEMIVANQIDFQF